MPSVEWPLFLSRCFIEDIREMAFATVLSIVHGSHENPSSTFWRWTLPPQTLNLSIPIYFVVLQNSQLGLLALVLDLLRRGIDFLLTLLAATPETEDEVKSRLFLDVVI